MLSMPCLAAHPSIHHTTHSLQAIHMGLGKFGANCVWLPTQTLTQFMEAQQVATVAPTWPVVFRCMSARLVKTKEEHSLEQLWSCLSEKLKPKFFLGKINYQLAWYFPIFFSCFLHPVHHQFVKPPM
jgi:hypothetical protein